MKPWNIKHIKAELETSFSQRHTAVERSVWRVYATKDCRRILGGRTPTPGEVSILERFNLHV